MILNKCQLDEIEHRINHNQATNKDCENLLNHLKETKPDKISECDMYCIIDGILDDAIREAASEIYEQISKKE